MAINRAYSRACSLRGNTLVAQQGLFFLLFTLAVKSEHHPEMFKSLITGSTFLAKMEKDHGDRDHLWTEIRWNSAVFHSKSDSGICWMASFLLFMVLGDSQDFPGYTEQFYSNVLYKPPFPPHPRNFAIKAWQCPQKSHYFKGSIFSKPLQPRTDCLISWLERTVWKSQV